ncbi:MAG: hypothetical protein PSU94_17230 [Lacunisphaera sp.]|nr:hypothetical protein [Lacunisphaera sp.]
MPKFFKQIALAIGSGLVLCLVAGVSITSSRTRSQRTEAGRLAKEAEDDLAKVAYANEISSSLAHELKLRNANREKSLARIRNEIAEIRAKSTPLAVTIGVSGSLLTLGSLLVIDRQRSARLAQAGSSSNPPRVPPPTGGAKPA